MGFCPYLQGKKCTILGQERTFFQRTFSCSLSCSLYNYEIQKRTTAGTVRHNDSYDDSHDDNGGWDLEHHCDSGTSHHDDYKY